MPKAHIIGLGKSGIAGAKLLKKEGWEVTLSDAKNSEDFQDQKHQLKSQGIDVLLSHIFKPEAEENLDLVVVSPGVPWDIPSLLKAREMGIETIGEMELAWRYLNKRPWVAITGTNGKTTTTALIAAIFQTAGLHAPACGNIGYAACELALSETPPDWVIAEVSSYQIESSSTLAPRIGVWTTFTPDHLSRHKTLENYFNIKAKLLHQSELQIVNGDDPYLRQNVAQTWKNACWTSVQGKEGLVGDFERGIYIENNWVIYQGEKVVEASALRMVGSHNLQNLLMAVAAAKLAGIDNKFIAKAIAEFPGVAHRLEHICNINGVDFINDSKATNYDAAEVGLASVEAPTILIAGGEAKAGDDSGWLKVIQEKAVAVLLIGSAAVQFAQRLQDINHPRYEIVETMAKAVKRGAELAPQLNAKVVLLSPACASFDQYQNFEQRGDDFRNCCLELAG